MTTSKPKAIRAWGFVNPKNRMFHVDRSKRWGWIHVGIVTKWGARREDFWKEKGYRCIRVTITPE